MARSGWTDKEISTRQRGIRALWLAALLALAGLTGAAQDPVTQGPVAQAPAAQAAGQTPPAPDPAEAAAQSSDDQAAALAAEAAAEPDTDHDGMPDAWEDFFGLNKNNAADASGDLDGDGVSNLQEYLTKGHPNGRVHRYFAEGATGFFKTSIGLFNPSPTATAKVQVAFVTEQGTTYTKRVELGPRRRATVSANTELGLVLTGISTHVESNIPVAADRFMRWGLTNYGSSLDSGVEAPSTTWYFAEGATGQFLLYYLLFNPGNLPATVQLKYLREGGPPIIKSVTVPAHQRETVFVNTQDLSLLVAAVGAVVTSNRPIVAERAMYQSSLLELYGSGGASSGAPALSDTWYFAEGATGPFFDEYILLGNASTTTTADAEVTFRRDDGTPYVKHYTVAPQTRRTIWINDEASSVPALAALATGPVSVTVRSTIPIVAERSMWWARNGFWYENHASTGLTTPGPTWMVAEAGFDGPTNDQTFVLIANTSAQSGVVRVTAFKDDGTNAAQDYTLGAFARQTVEVGPTFGLSNNRVSVLIESQGSTPLPVVVDYVRYSTTGFRLWNAGGAASAIPLAPSDAAPTVTATTPASGATNVPRSGNLTVTFSEPVNVTPTAFTLECPGGTAIPFTNLTASPATTFTLDPTASLPVSSTCLLTIKATQVTDADTIDPPDQMTADVVVPFSTGACPAITISPNTLPAASIGAAYGPFTFTPSAGATPITWSTSGTLPTGLTLSASGVLSGTPTASGSFDFTVTATDVDSCSGSQAFTVASSCPTITVSPGTLSPGNVGVSYGPVQFTQTGAPGSVTWSMTGGTLPAGMTLDAAGLLSGTPTAAGTHTFTVTATDSNGGCTGSVTVTLSVSCPVITVTPTAVLDATVGVAYTAVQFAQTGAPTAVTWTVSSGTLPAGMTVNAAGLFSGTPTAPGTHTFTVTATDANGCSGSVTVTINVTCPEITVTPATLGDGTVGVAYTPVQFAQTGAPTAVTWSVSSGTLPTGMTLDASGLFAGTPTAPGTYTFTVTATDANGCTGAVTVTIQVTCPVITLAPTTLVDASVGTAYTPVQFTQTGSPTSVTWAVTGGTLPAGMSFSSGGLFSGTPTAPGTHTFTVTATDANGCTGTVTVTIQVSCPVITITPATLMDATVGVAYTPVQFTQTGSPTAVTWAVTAGALPTGLSLSSSGLLSGTPTVPGSSTFTITATDANGCTGTVTITIQTTCPTITVSPTSLTNGVAGVAYGPVTFTQTGSPTSVTWSLSAGTLPAGVTLSAAGVLSGTPTQTGTFPITVLATDANGCTGSVSVTLQIDCPTITITPGTVTNAVVGTAYTPVVFSQTGGVGTVTWAMTSGTLPAGMTFNPATRTLSGTPTAAGTHTFTLTATDSNGCTGTITITLIAECPTITITPATFGPASGGLPFTQTFNVSGGTTPHTWSMTGSVPGLTFTPATRTLSGTPTQPGAFPLTITATDANGCSGSITPTLTVLPNAVDDVFVATLLGNVAMSTMTVGGFSVLSNDVMGPSPTITGYSAVSQRGGTVTMVQSGADAGKFTYDPPAGYEGTDTFTYTASDGTNSDTATVTVTVGGGVIWFIDAAASCSTCDGRLSRPFKTLAAFNAINDGVDNSGANSYHPADNDRIFLAENASDYSGSLTLRSGQRLIGQDAVGSLATLANVTPHATQAALPVLNSSNGTIARIAVSSGSGVLLNSGNHVRGLSVATGSGSTGVRGNNFGALALSDVSVSGSGIGVFLNNGTPTASFTSVSSSGATHGIVLTNTSGSFTVTGVGSTAGSGGTLSGATGAGDSANVVLSSAQNVTLNNMVIQNSSQDGVRGTTVSGFAMTNTTVSGNGTAVGHAGLDFAGLTGTVGLTNVTVTGSYQDNVAVRNTSGTVTITVDNSNFTSNSVAGGGDGLLLDASATATITSTVTNSHFTANKDDHFQASAANSAQMNVTFVGNTLVGGHAAATGGGLTINAATGAPGFSGGVKYDIRNNSINGGVLSGMTVNLGTSAAGSVMQGRISGNTIGTAAVTDSGSAQGFCLAVDAHGNGTHTVLIENNVLRQCHDRGLNIVANDGNGAANITVRNNNISHSNGSSSREAFNLGAGAVDPNIFGIADSHTVCLDLGGGGNPNTLQVSANPPTLGSFLSRQRFNTTVRLPGYAGGTADTTAVRTFIIGNNPGASASSQVTASGTGGGYIGGAACAQPTLP